MTSAVTSDHHHGGKCLSPYNNINHHPFVLYMVLNYAGHKYWTMMLMPCVMHVTMCKWSSKKLQFQNELASGLDRKRDKLEDESLKS